MFEQALKNNYRYPSKKGLMTTEDLFSLSLTELNEIAKTVNKKIKDIEEESFIPGPNFNVTNDSKMLEIVKHIINAKVTERDARILERDRAEQKQKIMATMVRKNDESLENMSVEELKKMLESL